MSIHLITYVHLRTHASTHPQSAVDVSQFNLAAYFHEVATGERYEGGVELQVRYSCLWAGTLVFQVVSTIQNVRGRLGLI